MFVNNMILKIITICIIIFILFIITKKIEQYSNYEDTQNNIWMYWENKPNKEKPVYLDLCYDTIVKHNKHDFKIHLLNKKTLSKYLPNFRNDLNLYMNIPQKTDLIRLELLYNYGGIWVDSDTIMMRSMLPLLKKLKKYDFVGFGCSGNTCSRLESGYPMPSNWCLIARKKSILVKKCLKKAYEILEKNPEILKKRYHILGRELIWNTIKNLKKNTDWDYLHIPSKCVEQDSNGIKYRNYRMVSNESYDHKCYDKAYFIPIYNTAPGFPQWFLDLSKNKLLHKDVLFSKLIRKSLNI